MTFQVLTDLLALIELVERKELTLDALLSRAFELIHTEGMPMAMRNCLEQKLNTLDDEYSIAMSQIFSGEFDIALNPDVGKALRDLREWIAKEAG